MHMRKNVFTQPLGNSTRHDKHSSFSIQHSAFTTVLRVFVAVFFIQTAAFAQHPDFPTLDTLPVLDSLPEYEVAALARRLADQTSQVREVFVQKADRAALEREVAADQLAVYLADTLATTEEIDAFKKALKTAQNIEKAALLEVKKADKVLTSVQKVAEMEGDALRKSLSRAYKQVVVLIPKPEEPEEKPIAEVIGAVAVSDPSNTVPPPAQADEPVSETEPAAQKAPKKLPAARPTFKKYDPAADVLLNPPKRGCTLVTDTRDEFSGERRRELQKEELFRFTNPSLKAYLQDREHIVCLAAVATNSGTQRLQLQFNISDANAKRTFGSLPKNGVALLKFLDGETLTLYNIRADEGSAGEDKVTYTFTGQYVIDPGMFKKMQKSLLDKVRIAWATGYEDYEVHNVDLLNRQLDCLLK